MPTVYNVLGEKLIISSPSSDGNCSTSMGYYAVLGNEIILPIFGSQLDVVIIEECDQSSCVNYCSKNIVGLINHFIIIIIYNCYLGQQRRQFQVYVVQLFSNKSEVRTLWNFGFY